MSFNVEGKVAFVTGGASGIGLAIVRALLQNGAKGVAIIDVNETDGKRAEESFLKDFGPNSCIFLHCNVAERKQLENAFELTANTFKQLDIVINNVGIVEEKDYEKCIAVNLISCVAGTKLALDHYLPKFKSGEQGVILNTASVVGLKPHHLYPIYSATKSGIIGLCRAYGAAKEVYEQTKIKVLTVCPGATDTPAYGNDVTAQKLKNNNVQSSDHVGESVISIIQNGKTGSVWVVTEGKPPHQEQFPPNSYTTG